MLSPTTFKAVRRSGAIPGSDYLLEVDNVRKEFPGVVALDNVNLRIRRGTVHALMGENGAGKVDADEDHRRRLPARYRRDPPQGQPGQDRVAASSPRSRHRHDPSGAQPDAVHDGRREHLDPTRAGKCLRPDQPPRTQPPHRGAVQAALDRHRPAIGGARSFCRDAPDDRDRQGGLLRIRYPDHGRADLGPHRSRSDPPLQDHRGPESAGQGHHLHHAQDGRALYHRG